MGERSRLWRAVPVSWWLVGIYVTSVLVHFRALRYQAGFPLLATDEAQYVAVGENLRLGLGFLIRGEFHSGLPPAYPLFVAFAHSIGSDPRVSALFLSCACISLALFPAYRLARLIGLDRALAAMAAAAAVFLPNTLLAGLYMTETLSYPLFLATVYAVARWLERPSTPHALFAGAMLSLVMLTKVAALSLAAAVIVAVIVLSVWPGDARRSRRAASALVVFGLVLITQLAWQAVKARHNEPGFGMYGRVVSEFGLSNLKGHLLAAYVADFLLAPGLLVVVPAAIWFYRHARERRALATLLGATLILQVAIHGFLEVGLTGLVQERLYMYSLPITAMLAIAGVAGLSTENRLTKTAVIVGPLLLLLLLNLYPFLYIPVLDVPWIAALGSTGWLDVLHFNKMRALGIAALLALGMGAAILLLAGRRGQVALAIFIIAFNAAVFVSSTRKMSVLSNISRNVAMPISDWLASQQLAPHQKLIVAGELAYFQDTYRRTPTDQFFVDWQRRFLPVITELQLESLFRLDLRLAPSPEQVAAMMMPGDRLLTATRMSGLQLVDERYPLYLYTRDRADEPIRPLYAIDWTSESGAMHLIAGTYRATLHQTGEPAGEFTVEAVTDVAARVLARRTMASGGSFEFTTAGDERVTLRVENAALRKEPLRGIVEFVAPIDKPADVDGSGAFPVETAASESHPLPLYLMCSLDSVNGVGLAPMYSVPQGAAINVRGWTRADESATLRLELESAGGRYVLPTQQSVADQPGIVAFSTQANNAPLVPETYRMRLVRTDGDRVEACRNVWNVTVTAPAASP